MILVEYAKPILVQISDKEAKLLRAASIKWKNRLRLKYFPLSIEKIATEKYLIGARGVAGFVTVGSIHIEIIPKYISDRSSDKWKTAIWRFLSYGKGFSLFEDTKVEVSKGEGIVDLLAELFLESLKGASELGYALSYESKNTVSDTLVGVLNPEYYHELLPVKSELNVIADELSYDNEINQLLKWAGKQLESNVESNYLRRMLVNWSLELGAVKSKSPHRRISAHRLINYSHLKQSIEIAELLLDNSSINFSNNSLNFPGFLWDSDALFERAIFRLFKEVMYQIDIKSVKKKLDLAESPNGQKMITIPDFIFMKNGKEILVGDAKYKIFRNKPVPQDFYQIMAASSLLDLDSAILVYPSASEGLEVQEFSLLSGTKPFQIFTLQIGLGAFKTVDSMKKLKSALKEWLHQLLISDDEVLELK